MGTTKAEERKRPKKMVRGAFISGDILSGIICE